MSFQSNEAQRIYYGQNREKITSRMRQLYKGNPQKYIERSKTYYLSNREDLSVYAKNYYQNNKEKLKARNQKWAKEHLGHDFQARMDKYRFWRTKALTALGMKCIKCGIDDVRCLQIDHINGNRKTEPKINPRKRWKEISEHPDFSRYQVLCANCNWIKKHDRREVFFKYPIKILET